MQFPWQSMLEGLSPSAVFADQTPNVYTDTLIQKKGNAITGIMLLKVPFEGKKKKKSWSDFIYTRSPQRMITNDVHLQ